MLVLSRKEGESITVDGPATIKVVRIAGCRTTLGIDAEPHVNISRGAIRSPLNTRTAPLSPKENEEPTKAQLIYYASVDYLWKFEYTKRLYWNIPETDRCTLLAGFLPLINTEITIALPTIDFLLEIAVLHRIYEHKLCSILWDRMMLVYPVDLGQQLNPF